MKENWARFTLMDGRLLVAALALGMGFTTLRVGTEPAIEWTVSSVISAGVFAGPLILVASGVADGVPRPAWVSCYGSSRA